MAATSKISRTLEWKPPWTASPRRPGGAFHRRSGRAVMGPLEVRDHDASRAGQNVRQNLHTSQVESLDHLSGDWIVGDLKNDLRPDRLAVLALYARENAAGARTSPSTAMTASDASVSAPSTSPTLPVSRPYSRTTRGSRPSHWRRIPAFVISIEGSADRCFSGPSKSLV